MGDFFLEVEKLPLVARMVLSTFGVSVCDIAKLPEAL